MHQQPYAKKQQNVTLKKKRLKIEKTERRKEKKHRVEKGKEKLWFSTLIIKVIILILSTKFLRDYEWIFRVKTYTIYIKLRKYSTRVLRIKFWFGCRIMIHFSWNLTDKFNLLWINIIWKKFLGLNLRARYDLLT